MAASDFHKFQRDRTRANNELNRNIAAELAKKVPTAPVQKFQPSRLQRLGYWMTANPATVSALLLSGIIVILILAHADTVQGLWRDIVDIWHSSQADHIKPH